MRAVTRLAAVLMLVALEAAAEGPSTVVLKSGAVLEVASAKVKGSQVQLTFADGRLQAYPVEEVDLAASGLAEGQQQPQPTEAQASSLAGMVGPTAAESRLTLTDLDVAHVLTGPGTPTAEAAAEGAEEGAAPSSTTALLVSDLRQRIEAGILTLTGNVTNSGAKGVTAVNLDAQAVDGEGKVTGRGSTAIGQTVPAGGSVGFTMTFPVSGLVTNVKVQASAAVADFDFKPVEKPATEGASPETTGAEQPPAETPPPAAG